MERPIESDYRFTSLTTHGNAANSSLLRLPAEIRNMIYERVLETATVNRDRSSSSSERYCVILNGSNLLLACRQIQSEARLFQKYRRLDIRMESRRVPDLISCLREHDRARIVEVGMFQSLASALSRQVHRATIQGQYTSPWAASGDLLFPSLERIVVTYPTYLNQDGYDVKMALRMLFDKMELEVEFRAALYW